MKSVNPYIEEKMDEAVAHYMNSHPNNEVVHVDNGMPLSAQEEGARQVVALMHPPNFHSSIHRSVGDVGESMSEPNGWGEEMLDADRLAQIVGLLTPNTRSLHGYVKFTRTDVESQSLLDAPIRLFNSQPLDEQHNGQLGVQQSVLPSLPRCTNAEAQWLTDKPHKSPQMLSESEPPVLEIASPAPSNKHHSKKSLPHKKRISKKLKRTAGSSTPQQDMVVLSVNQEEILPDNYTPTHAMQETHHTTHEPSSYQLRAVLLCQLCGDYYGEDQLKFYQHLKHHYEPQSTIIIENPVNDLGIDKMTNTCIVDNHVSLLPDSLVELSLENTMPTTKSIIYQPIKDTPMYSTSDKAHNYNSNKVLYSMAVSDKEPEHVKNELAYESHLDKHDVYSCNKCNAVFRKQRHYEMHVKEEHSKQMSEEINEFSEPEDLMEGIQVNVAEDVAIVANDVNADNEAHYNDNSLMLTVDNGHVHQEHVRHWYIRDGVEAQCDGESFCPLYPSQSPQHRQPDTTNHFKDVHQPHVLNNKYLPMTNVHPDDTPRENKLKVDYEDEAVLKRNNIKKKFECETCGKIFKHRNSLLYHILSHKGNRPHKCKDCGKAFFTTSALKIHTGIHNNNRPHKCKECGKMFRQWGDLKYHTASIHSQQKPFECEYCGKKFARKYSYNLHVRIHTGEKNYKCHFCSKAFRASSYRLTHMMMHTGEKPHKCDQCTKSFRSAGDLRRHSSVHKKPAEVKEKNDKVELEKEEEKKKKKAPAIAKNIAKKSDKKSSKKIDDKITPNVTISRSDLKYEMELETFRNSRDRSANLRSVYIETVGNIVEGQKAFANDKVKDEGLTQLTDVRPNVIENRESKDNGPAESEIDMKIENGFIESLTAMYNIPT